MSCAGRVGIDATQFAAEALELRAHAGVAFENLLQRMAITDSQSPRAAQSNHLTNTKRS
jgi:hypothetical protein